MFGWCIPLGDCDIRLSMLWRGATGSVPCQGGWLSLVDSYVSVMLSFDEDRKGVRCKTGSSRWKEWPSQFACEGDHDHDVSHPRARRSLVQPPNCWNACQYIKHNDIFNTPMNTKVLRRLCILIDLAFQCRMTVSHVLLSHDSQLLFVPSRVTTSPKACSCHHEVLRFEVFNLEGSYSANRDHLAIFPKSYPKAATGTW